MIENIWLDWHFNISTLDYKTAEQSLVGRACALGKSALNILCLNQWPQGFSGYRVHSVFGGQITGA